MLETVDARKAVAESGSDLHRVLEKLPSGAYTCDSEGLITYFNQNALKIWGRAAKLNDPVDRYCGSFKLFSSEGLPIAHNECSMAKALQSGKEFDAKEIVIERPDGSRVTVLAHASPWHDEFGRLTGALNILVDISDRKRTEEVLKASEERFREADRRKDEFLAMLAHELRNPLAPISNSLHLLRLCDDLSPTLDRVREIMERQVQHLIRLVDDLLDVSRVSRGKLELRKELVELAAVIRSAVETSRPLIEAAGHQLAITLPPQPLTLQADPVRMAQVISNLLNNAAKYTEGSGQIWLSARQEGGEAVVSVRDTGVGIPAEMLPRVFDMFAQMDCTLDRAQGGLGIGLSLAKKLTAMHDGRIEAHSNGLGQGSEFLVYLPIVVGAANASHSSTLPRSSNPTLPKRTILVVDDTRSAAYVLAKLLEKMGQEVRIADNAVAALEQARLTRPDVIISDIAMPYMNGYELARRLRQLPGLDDIMLVALTGYGQDGDKQRAKEAGFDHHLVKPVSLECLREMLTLSAGAKLLYSGAGENIDTPARHAG